ncbi:hypothetical protein, partial [Mesorhizobium sp. M1E.F.Ca.ET.041.01.1.1]|uniref:hypothetical protein n=1 Tax=Mesorhizobium sp. M1E.F.Ca.ET.041.01.1.1 TaxID=2496759 RepID=UPI001AECB1EA
PERMRGTVARQFSWARQDGESATSRFRSRLTVPGDGVAWMDWSSAPLVRFIGLFAVLKQA